jgi:hypothetical protein
LRAEEARDQLQAMRLQRLAQPWLALVAIEA